MLVRSRPEGISAGGIAVAMGIRPSTLSTTLNILAAAELVHRRREGREIFYTARLDRLAELVRLLADSRSAAGQGPR